VLSLPVLATVPYVATASEKARTRKRRLIASLGGAVCVAAAGFVVWSLQLWNSIR
jgi:hypothetical protein